MSIVLTRETSYELKDFRNICTNCLDATKLVTEIRVEFVPVGTPLTVADEFLQTEKKQRSSDETTHYLLVEDDKANLAEISKSDFELYVLDALDTQYPWGSETKTVVQTATEMLSKGEVLTMEHCFQKRDALTTLVAFVDDFNLEQDIQFTNDASTDCSVISYSNLDAFMTANFYFGEWGLDGKMEIRSE